VRDEEANGGLVGSSGDNRAGWVLQKVLGDEFERRGNIGQRTRNSQDPLLNALDDFADAGPNSSLLTDLRHILSALPDDDTSLATGHQSAESDTVAIMVVVNGAAGMLVVLLLPFPIVLVIVGVAGRCTATAAATGRRRGWLRGAGGRRLVLLVVVGITVARSGRSVDGEGRDSVRPRVVGGLRVVMWGEVGVQRQTGQANHGVVVVGAGAAINVGECRVRALSVNGHAGFVAGRRGERLSESGIKKQ